MNRACKPKSSQGPVDRLKWVVDAKGACANRTAQVLPEFGVRRLDVAYGIPNPSGDSFARALLAVFFTGAMVATTLQAVLVVAAAQRFGNAADVGWFYSAVGLGGVLGTLLVVRWRPRHVSAAILGALGAAELLSYLGFEVFPAVVLTVTLLATSSIAAVLAEARGAIDL